MAPCGKPAIVSARALPPQLGVATGKGRWKDLYHAVTFLFHEAMPLFRHKALTALLASAAGAVGAHGLYLGRKLWWIPLVVTAGLLPLLIGTSNWYQSIPFFLLMGPVFAGFIEGLILALMSDPKFDARFNARTEKRNRSGWGAVLVAVATVFIGGTALMTVLALLNQTIVANVPGLR